MNTTTLSNKNCYISLRVSEAEKNAILSAAQAKNLNISDFVRHLLLGDPKVGNN